ncbi:hypothetical protein NO1_0678 [Candidatus Termititenax aidoneus]|uniref:Heme chaperone HemW n=1 Tax=Termititenax aidoneus TaxID=2218524 RepID=A0A388T9H3_TERA1|nr:hypothetical protein NO1_0678 [Candidatus Termititenax aidoneus]
MAKKIKLQFSIAGGLSIHKSTLAFILAREQHSEWFYPEMEVASVYDCFPGFIWNGGRIYSQSVMSAEQMIQRVNFFNNRNIGVNFTFTNCALTAKHLCDPLGNWALEKFVKPINAIVINSPILEEYIRQNYPQCKMISSVTKVIRDIDRLLADTLKYDAVVVAPEFNHDWQALSKLPVDKIVILVNEGCAPYCSDKLKHYKMYSEAILGLATKESIKYFCPDGRKGNKTILSRKQLLVLAEKLKIKHFKLNGRDATTLETLLGYYKEYFVLPEFQAKFERFMRENNNLKFWNKQISAIQWDKNIVDRLAKVYQEVLFDTVKKICQKNITPLAVYIHSPFCPSQCKYCAYRGRVPLKGELEKYYNEYLPAQINNYREILQAAEVSSWFFGGGTPSLMTPEMLRHILSLLPGLKERGEKIFEIHPANFNIELLDILQEYNFHNVIVGVQSFAEETLRKAKRIPAGREQIKSIIQEIQKRGMAAWVDLVGYVNDDPGEIAVLGQDIYTALELEPDEISICINYFLREKYLQTTLELLTVVLQTVGFGWQWEDFIAKPADIRKHLENFKVLRLYNKSKPLVLKQRNFLNALATHTEHFVKQSFLGIGSYQNQTHGTISCLVTEDYKYFFTEANKDWQPRYFITHTADFLAEAQRLLSDMRDTAASMKRTLQIKQVCLERRYYNPTGTLGLGEDISFLSATLERDFSSSLAERIKCESLLQKYQLPPDKPFIDLSKIGVPK